MVMEEAIAMEEAMEVEKGDGLKTRQRRRRKAVEESEFETEKLEEEDGMASTEVEANEAEEKEETEEAGGRGGDANDEHTSVYYDPDQGVWKCRDCTWIYWLKFPGRDHMHDLDGYFQVMKSLTLLKSFSDPPIKGVEDVDDVSVMKLKEIDAVVPGKLASGKFALNHAKVVIQTELDQLFKNVKAEEGPSSYTSSEIQSEETKYDNEIEELEQLAILDKSKLKVEGFDLKRILEEQDTHDLICPECKLCLTRMVLLRKRKRTTTEPPTIAPIQKIFKGCDIFGCLSCFTIFIPKGPIKFRKFGKKGEKQVHSSEENIERKDSWISSIFSLKESKKQERESGANLVQSKEESSLSIMSGSAGEIKSIEENNNEVILQHKFSSLKIQEKVKDQFENINPDDQVISSSDTTVHIKERVVNDVYLKNSENDTTMHVSISKTEERVETSAPMHVTGPNVKIQIGMPEQNNRDSGARNEWDVLKSLVYGGLIELIVSLSIVSSAAGANGSTLNVVAIGLANVIGGVPLISHNLFDLRNTQEATVGSEQPTGRYWELLGWRKNIGRHFFVAIISYILVGLLPAGIYGFSFHESDNKNYKLIAVAAASLVCTALLAIGKAHVQPEKAYFKTVFYYLCLAVSVSGLSYVAGVMFDRFLEDLGLLNHSTAPVPPSLDISWNVPELASF